MSAKKEAITGKLDPDGGMPTFNVIEIKELPKKTYDKPSRYDPVLDAFLKTGYQLSNIEMQKKDGSGPIEGEYLTRQLSKRIEIRELNTVWAKMVNKLCYLLATTPEEHAVLMKKRADTIAKRKANK